MRIGLLVPSILMSKRFRAGRIFAPFQLAVDLADGLVKNGHEVFFYSTDDIDTKAIVRSTASELLTPDLKYYQFRNRSEDEQAFTITEIRKRDFEYAITLLAYQDALKGKLDIIHSYHDFGAHYFNTLTGFPTVYTLHDPMPKKGTIEYFRYLRFARHNFISISNRQRIGMDIHFCATVYHGIDLHSYQSGDGRGGYLLYFGRILPDKAPHLVIDLGRKFKIPVVIASSQDSANRSQSYYEKMIAPYIDGKNVREVGFLQGEEKSRLIQDAFAFVLPIQWDEPFGLVMIEAMACGTPVIAYNRGSVSELILDNSTGFIVEDTKEAESVFFIKEKGMSGLEKAAEYLIHMEKNKYLTMRNTCRSHVENKFSLSQMVTAYENVYTDILAKKS